MSWLAGPPATAGELAFLALRERTVGSRLDLEEFADAVQDAAGYQAVLRDGEHPGIDDLASELWAVEELEDKAEGALDVMALDHT